MGKIIPLLLVSLCVPLRAQTNPGDLALHLGRRILPPEVTASELSLYLMKKVIPPAPPRAAEQWTAEAKQLRKRVLGEIVFHGWPREWVDSPLKVDDLGLMASGPGYRMRKLRYEIIPGFQSTAILYEPENLRGKVPAILNVNGHSPGGKSVEFKQKRCINQARRGILSLNLEWPSFGELNQPENKHWFGAHLDLVGANGVGLFYLAMRRGLDYLDAHPNVDRTRLGVTGLSGGGWQTIILSSLDERVWAAAPVAGYSGLTSRIERAGDIGDVEQNPTDLLTIADYPQFTAMRAPRPTLLVYNAEDDCCFRGPLVKPYVYDAIRPFFKLYGHEDRFVWHLNTDPSDHNYQLDNRQASYRFFAAQFGMPPVDAEIPVDAGIKSQDELVVGLPADNLTILGVAKKLAARNEKPAGPAQKAVLQETVRYRPVELQHALAVTSTHSRGLETRSFRFQFSNGLSASAVWLKALAVVEPAPATVVLDDKGKKAAAAAISARVNRGEQVLALDLLFMGDAVPQAPGMSGFAQLLATTGDRPLGMEAAQLIAAVRWLKKSGAPSVRLETSGIRSQVIGLAAAVLEPGLFSGIKQSKGMSSFAHLLEAPVNYEDAADLFCLDLFKKFDIGTLAQANKDVSAR